MVAKSLSVLLGVGVVGSAVLFGNNAAEGALLAQDGLTREMLTQTPTLAVAAFFGMQALKYLGKRDEATLLHLEKRDEALKDIGKECHAVQERATEAIIRNSEALGKVGDAIRQVCGKEDRRNNGD